MKERKVEWGWSWTEEHFKCQAQVDEIKKLSQHWTTTQYSGLFIYLDLKTKTKTLHVPYKHDYINQYLSPFSLGCYTRRTRKMRGNNFVNKFYFHQNPKTDVTCSLQNMKGSRTAETGLKLHKIKWWVGEWEEAGSSISESARKKDTEGVGLTLEYKRFIFHLYLWTSTEVNKAGSRSSPQPPLVLRNRWGRITYLSHFSLTADCACRS